MSKKYIKTVREQLRVVVNKFAAREIENLVMPLFPEVTLHEIHRQLNMGNEYLSAENAIILIEAIITKNRVKFEDVKTRILTLHTIDISRHSDKKIWYGHILTGKNRGADYSDYAEVQAEIENSIARSNIDVEADHLLYDGALYICIRDKVKSRRVVNCSPLYFALFPLQGYLFCTKKSVSSDYLHPIIESFGFESSSPVDIMGKDLRSLVNLLENEELTKIKPKLRGETYSVKDPESSETGTDYTESLHRKEYAESCRSSNRPKLESLIIDVPEQQWKHKNVSAKLHDTMRFQCEIRSRNVPEFLVKLTEANVLTPPLPAYIRTVMSFPKRTVRVEDDEFSDENEI